MFEHQQCHQLHYLRQKEKLYSLPVITFKIHDSRWRLLKPSLQQNLTCSRNWQSLTTFQFMKIQVIIILLTVSRADRSRESISACDSANPFDFSSFGFALPLLSSFWLLLAPVIKTWKSLIVSFFYPYPFYLFSNLSRRNKNCHDISDSEAKGRKEDPTENQYLKKRKIYIY